MYTEKWESGEGRNPPAYDACADATHIKKL